jgi:hypothetical protein
MRARVTLLLCLCLAHLRQFERNRDDFAGCDARKSAPARTGFVETGCGDNLHR